MLSLMPEPALLLCLLLTFSVVFQHMGSPQHLPNLALPPHPLAQGWPDMTHQAPNSSQSCPSLKRSHSSRASHTAAGRYSPCQTTLQGPVKAMGG